MRARFLPYFSTNCVKMESAARRAVLRETGARAGPARHAVFFI